jgi:YVTN family beta-propeller protein
VANYGTAEQPGSTLSIVDLEYPRELRRIELGEHRRPHGVAWFAPERIAVTSEASRSLVIVDPRAGRIVERFGTGQEGSHLVVVQADGSRAYVTNRLSGTTTVIDLGTGRKLGDVATGPGSEAIALTPDGREAWVAAREAGTLTIFDARTLEVLATVPMPGGPIRVAISSGGTALVSCTESGEVIAIDVASRRVIARRSLDLPMAESAKARTAADTTSSGALPVGLAVSADGVAVNVAATRLDKIARLLLPGLELDRAIDVPGEPDGMAVTPLLPKSPCHACEAPADPYGPEPAN